MKTEVQENTAEVKGLTVEDAKVVTEKLEVEIPATIDTLNKVKYQNLLETFTVLGVPEAWKPGSKRSKMIAVALEKLAIIRDLESKGLQGEELVKAKEKAYLDTAVEVSNQAVKESLAKATEAVESNKALVEEVEKKELSKIQIEKNLKIIDANLKGASQGGRAILLKKRKVLQDLLN